MLEYSLKESLYLDILLMRKDYVMFAKRICTLLICSAFLFSVFGCSKKPDSETPGNVTGTTSRNEETVDLNAINDRFSGNNSDAQASSEGLEYVEVERVIGDGPNAYRLVGIGSCTDTDIVISNSYNDLEVRWIGPSAFQNNTSIESVTSYVGQLESNAFAGCSSLKTINFPNSDSSTVFFSFMDHCLPSYDPENPTAWTINGLDPMEFCQQNNIPTEYNGVSIFAE